MSSGKHHKHQDCEIKNLDIIENEVDKKWWIPNNLLIATVVEIGVCKIKDNIYNKKNLLNMFMEDNKLNKSLKNHTKISVVSPIWEW